MAKAIHEQEASKRRIANGMDEKRQMHEQEASKRRIANGMDEKRYIMCKRR